MVKVRHKVSPDKRSSSATFQSEQSYIHWEVIVIINFILEMKNLNGEASIKADLYYLLPASLSTLFMLSVDLFLHTVGVRIG